MKFAEKMVEGAKMQNSKSIMSETLFGDADVFRGRSFNLCVDLHHQLLDDKVPVSMMKQSSSISSTNMVQSLTTVEQGAHGEDEEVKNEVAQDKAFTMIQQFR